MSNETHQTPPEQSAADKYVDAATKQLQQVVIRAIFNNEFLARVASTLLNSHSFRATLKNVVREVIAERDIDVAQPASPEDRETDLPERPA